MCLDDSVANFFIASLELGFITTTLWIILRLKVWKIVFVGWIVCFRFGARGEQREK
jgi:hypothetical protein